MIRTRPHASEEERTSDRARRLLQEIYGAAVGAAAPEPVTRAALAEGDLTGRDRVLLLAIGKASLPMAAAATEWLAVRGRTPIAGAIVIPTDAWSSTTASPHPALTLVAGDHPVPSDASSAAAEAVAAVTRQVEPGDLMLVLLSGGATSLIAAPIPGISRAELEALFDRLLGSGLDIAEMNAVRKRFTRWGGGRLALALAPAATRVLIISDVPGDDPATIGSGPCTPDPMLAADVLRILRCDPAISASLPGSIQAHLELTALGEREETPKPGHPAFESVITRVIANNRLALLGAARRAGALGVQEISVLDQPLTGPAAAMGYAIARELLRARGMILQGGAISARTACLIWGGETTVTLGDALAGSGGRCQELALAAAGVLHEAGESADQIALLAAGTDGRDGPTDAAGAVIDAQSWRAVRAAGRDPERDLRTHDSYRALDAAGALLRTGATGTNVMDVVVGVILG